MHHRQRTARAGHSGPEDIPDVGIRVSHAVLLVHDPENHQATQQALNAAGVDLGCGGDMVERRGSIRQQVRDAEGDGGVDDLRGAKAVDEFERSVRGSQMVGAG
jgi:hypothetical protein